MVIAPKWLKTGNSHLAGMLPWNVPTECLKNYCDPINCMAFGANSYKMVEAIPYTDFKFVSVPIKHGEEIEHSE